MKNRAAMNCFRRTCGDLQGRDAGVQSAADNARGEGEVMARQSIAFTPRLLPAPEAAAYLGVSESMLRGLGIPRKMLGTKRLFDRFDLDAFASDLPREGEDSEGNTCDAILGATP